MTTTMHDDGKTWSITFVKQNTHDIIVTVSKMGHAARKLSAMFMSRKL